MLVKKLKHPLLVDGQYIYPPTSASLVNLSDGRTGDEAFVTVGQEASTTTPVKPTYPLQEGSTPIYPKTTVDQVISRDGITPLSEDGVFQDDVLTLEEIEASTDLDGYAASASSVKLIKESLSTSSYSGEIVWNSAYTWDNYHYCEAHRSGKIMYLQVRAYKTSTPIPSGRVILTLPESMRPRENTSALVFNSLYGSETNSIFGIGGWQVRIDGTILHSIGSGSAYSCVASFVYILP